MKTLIFDGVLWHFIASPVACPAEPRLGSVVQTFGLRGSVMLRSFFLRLLWGRNIRYIITGYRPMTLSGLQIISYYAGVFTAGICAENETRRTEKLLNFSDHLQKNTPEPIHYKHSAVYNIIQYLTGKNLKDGMDFKYALKHVIIFRRFVTGKNKWT